MANSKDDTATVRSTVAQRATVAQGRTILMSDGSTMATIGFDKDGIPQKAARQVEYGPGQEVSLPLEEVLRLRTMGFLVDPNPPKQKEPSERGASIREPV